MKFLKCGRLLFISMLSLFILSCSNYYKVNKSDKIVEKKAIDFGTFKDGTYINTFFDLKVSIPEAWYVMDDEMRIELMRKGSQVVAGNDKNMNAVMNAADLQNVNLLTSYEKPIGTPVSSNPSIMILAENLMLAPGIKRGSDYHFHSRKLLESSPIAITFPKEVYEEKINGTSFDVMEMEMNIGNIKTTQKQYVAIINKYAFVVIISYQDEAGLEKLEGVLKTMQLKS